MNMNNGEVFDKDTRSVMALVNLLYKLRIAGMEQRSLSYQRMVIQNPNVRLSRYVFKLAVVSLNQEYLVCVPYAKRDKSILP